MRTPIFITLAVALAACAVSSPVMDAGDGVYLVTATAAPIRGGSTGAYTVAYRDAQNFCISAGDGRHAVLVGTQERDVYQAAVFGNASRGTGGLGGSLAASGIVSLRFRCLR